MEFTTSPRPAVSVKISKDGIAWLPTTIEETSLSVFKIVSEEVTIRCGVFMCQVWCIYVSGIVYTCTMYMPGMPELRWKAQWRFLRSRGRAATGVEKIRPVPQQGQQHFLPIGDPTV